jgi:hypothetical protein
MLCGYFLLMPFLNHHQSAYKSQLTNAFYLYFQCTMLAPARRNKWRDFSPARVLCLITEAIMNEYELDELLRTHFHQSTPEGDFHRLKRGVWSRIDARERKAWWMSLAALLPPRTHFAPITAALVLGITLGMASSGKLPGQQEARLGFEVFSSNYSHPLKG